MKRWEVVLLCIIYLSALWLWSLPFQKNQLPYGEPDVASHIVLGDAPAQTDKVITTLPEYIDVRYGTDNQLVPHTLWYHPPYHMNFAIMQILAGSRFLPIYFFNAMLCTVIILITYVVIRRLYGILPAILSSVLLVFSARDIMIYVWGQWPERISYAMIPLVLYCFFSYTQSLLEKKPKVVYLYLTAVLVGVNLYMHPTGFMHTGCALAVYSLVFLATKRRLPFDWKPVFIAIGIFILVAAAFPIQTGSVLVGAREEKSIAPGSVGRLFTWYPDPNFFVGNVPPEYFSYSLMHGLWTLPFLILGIIFLLIRRKDQDLLLLSWLFSLYIMVHLDVVGMGRIHRSLGAEAHIFYPLIAIGVVSLLSFIKFPKGYKNYLKVGVVVGFVLVAVLVNGKAAYSSLNGAYPGPYRLTPAQFEVSMWMKANLPEGAKVADVGTLSLAKKRFMQFISMHHFVASNSDDDNATPNVVMFDYSDFVMFGQQAAQQIDSMKVAEQGFVNATVLYNKDWVKVYRVG